MRFVFLAYGLACYAIFLATFLYAVAFVAGADVPLTMDRGREASFGVALAIDLALILVFALQHSVMARQGFKRAWTRIVPASIERSTYVLLSSACLALLLWQWRPIGGAVWDFSGTWLALALVATSAVGWLVVLASTFLIDHFELFGLRQVWRAFRRRAAADTPFMTPSLYKLTRHPMYFGFVVAFWAAPRMTVGHLVFAAAMTFYVLVAIRFEERDLVGFFGRDYVEYQRRVRMLLPLPKR